MIFILDKQKPPGLILMLSEADVANMRAGRTTFVDQRQLSGAKFHRVVLSLHPSDTAALEMIRAAGHRVDQLAVPEPGPAESRCVGCEGCIATASMFEGKCIVCWATEAKRLKTERN